MVGNILIPGSVLERWEGWIVILVLDSPEYEDQTDLDGK